MRIDSSGNLLVGTTSTPSTLISATSGGGIALDPDSFSAWNREATASNHSHLVFNQTGVDAQYLQFRKDGAQVGDIGVNNGDNLRIQGNSAHSGIEFGTNAIFPHKNSSNVDATIDLGESTLRWKDLYLSGGVVFGTGGPSPITSNTLGDYEEGTWTPSLTNNTTATIVSDYGSWYRKIGDLVIYSLNMLLSTNSDSGGVAISIPFTSSAAYGYRYGGAYENFVNSTNYAMWYQNNGSTTISPYSRSATQYTYADYSNKYIQISGIFLT
jgi:hypothetical protein